MTIIGLLRREFALMRHHVTGIIQGLTKDDLLWAPPGVANPIGTTLLHVLTGEDRLIQSVLQGKPSLWEAGRWDEQIGIISLPVRGHDWTGVDLALLQAPALFAYAQVVDQATSTYLNLLNDTDLEEQVEVYGQEQARGEVLFSIIIHNTSHAGEIAALKGLQGIRGRTT
jgi:DinB superfamily